MRVLGIETSCDETSAAVVEDGRKILSNIVFTQIPFHQEFYGVVPELASRKHMEILHPVINQALREAGLSLCDIDAIGVTQEPGLMGSLLVGLTVAKTMAFALSKPLIPVNHIMAHVYAANLGEKPLVFPFIGLIVSGGHTLLTVFEDWLHYRIIGSTIDDAVGEAYDKVAKVMGLGYPGGPLIDKMAQEGDPNAVDLPLVMLNYQNDRYNFSYSGLKTAVVYHLERNPDYIARDLAASFQKKAIDILLKKTLLLSNELNISRVVIAGGVAANSYLRKIFIESPLELYLPSLKLCTDNAAMVAGLAYHLHHKDSGNHFGTDARDKVITREFKKSLRETK